MLRNQAPHSFQLIAGCALALLAGLAQAAPQPIRDLPLQAMGEQRWRLPAGEYAGQFRIDESLQRFAPVMERARADGVRVRGYVSTVLGCPYQGEVPLADVVRVARALHDMGCYEVSLGDTIGVGTPARAAAMLRAVATEVPVPALALHFHDTYGQALANVLACLEQGARVIDAAVAGTGGCPYAHGASGNVASEDVVYMLHGMGMQTGIDLDALADTGRWLAGCLGRETGSRVGRATACAAAEPAVS